MPRYEITGPDGAKYEISAPEGASEDDVREFAQSQFTAAPKREKTGAISALAQGAGQGVSFGFSDEIEGGARAAYDAATTDKSFTDAYGERVKTARDRQKQAAEDQPLAYYGGEIASALAVPGGLARTGIRGATRAAADLGLGARTAAAAREGAVYGAAYGAGTGEGIEGKIAGAGAGGVLGGALGAAVPGVVDAGSAVVRRAVQPFRGYTNPQGVGAEKMAEALARDAGSSGTPQDIAAASQRINQRGVNAADEPAMMVADLGGENTRRLVRQANDMPNDNVQRFNRRLDQRQAFQPTRIERSMTAALGSPDDYATAVGDIISRRGTQANADFQRALSRDIPMTPQLRSVLARPAMQNIFRNVEASLANEGEAIGRQTRMQALHKAKVEIDNQIGQARRAQAMGNDRTAGMDARTLQILKRDLMAAIDNPSYRRALDNFAGESALANAAEDGFERALTMHTEEIAPMLARMTVGEQEMWRLGASRALAGRIRQGNVTRDRTENMFSSPDIQMRLTSFFPDTGSRRQFQRSLVREARMADTRKAVQGGSKTSQNLTTADEAGAPMRAMVTAAQVARGSVLDPITTALGRVGNRFSGLTPASANSILEMAMRPAAQGMDPRVFGALQRAGDAPGRRARTSQSLLSALAAAQSQGP
jgi:hypothetical protein